MARTGATNITVAVQSNWHLIGIMSSHLFRRRMGMPLAYGLFPGKTQARYEREALLSEIQPKFVMSDQEKTLFNAVEETWPTTTKRGCFFHHKQALWRNLASHNLVLEYKVENSSVRKSFQITDDGSHRPRIHWKRPRHL